VLPKNVILEPEPDNNLALTRKCCWVGIVTWWFIPG